MSSPAYGLFDCVGIEIEYMIVDQRTLAVLPIADQVLVDDAGRPTSEIEFSEMAWSNELVAHVIELKTNGPAANVRGLANQFQRSVTAINLKLAEHGACLLPTAMHPTMDPKREMKLWPHDYNPVYATFNRVFDCTGHGWANLQSMHINLPFSNDAEFAKLHAAIRLLLPILPAIAASSPIVENAIAANRDQRMDVYRRNSRLVPEIAGQIIPEAITTGQEYQSQILEPIYAAMASHDPAGILRHEWCNSRGAIARFERGAIEIRVLDCQECPAMDLAIADLVIAVLKLMVRATWSELDEQLKISTDSLSNVFLACIRDAETSVIQDPAYLRQLGIAEPKMAAAQVWQHLIDSSQSLFDDPATAENLGVLSRRGTLASRILQAVGSDLNQWNSVYQRLAICLATGQPFE